jgi:hypothetical protein
MNFRELSLANCYFAKPQWRATLLHPYLYVIDSKRALNLARHRHQIVAWTE